MSMHVTIVDDRKDNLDFYRELLEESFELELIQNPFHLLDSLNMSKTDIVVLDIHMPAISGFDLYNKFKNLYPGLPVIFLSADPSEAAMIQALDMGAVDFIAKPVSLKELIARIKNKIPKNIQMSSKNVITFEKFSLLCNQQSAEVEGSRINLTPIEFKIIHLLAKNPNKILSREYITHLLWPDVQVKNQNIDTHLSNLRKKLMPFSGNIKTIKSRGYILRV